jgi:hypothetical protein
MKARLDNRVRYVLAEGVGASPNVVGGSGEAILSGPSVEGVLVAFRLS